MEIITINVPGQLLLEAYSAEELQIKRDCKLDEKCEGQKIILNQFDCVIAEPFKNDYPIRIFSVKI